MRVLSTLLFLAFSVHPGSLRAEAEKPLSVARADIDANYHRQLAELATRCDELGLSEQAEVTRHWIVPRDPRRQTLFLVPSEDPTKPDTDAPKVVHQWHNKFTEYRRAQASALWDLALARLDANEAAVAYQLVHEVVREDPSHTDGRRVLGYRLDGETWSLPRNPARPRAGRTTHLEFGWRRNRYWCIDSPHFRITTSHSGKAGLELAQKLEELHSLWCQLFFPFHTSDAMLRQWMIGGGKPALPQHRYEVILFKDRDEYVEQLARYERQIAMTKGYYAKRRQAAFFHQGDETLEATCFHEETHQLFSESPRAIRDPGERCNFWILEGVALYIESAVRYDGYFTLGGFDADWLQYARSRRFDGEFYMPFAELCCLGREGLQQHPDIRRIYSQSAGLAHFLMDANQGQYRDPLLDYLKSIYLGRDNPDSLRQLGGPLPAEIDTEYPPFLVVDDRALQQRMPGHPLRNLALGRTAVTDAGMAALANWDLSQLRWLDISRTQVTDAGLAFAEPAGQLNQLDLAETPITDDGLKTVAHFDQLEELDLSHTHLSDAGLAHLEGLTRLKILVLTECPITDAALSSLQHLTALEQVDLRSTNVTDEGIQTLRQRLPHLASPD